MQDFIRQQFVMGKQREDIGVPNYIKKSSHWKKLKSINSDLKGVEARFSKYQDYIQKMKQLSRKTSLISEEAILPEKPAHSLSSKTHAS
jgi:hypothetical protein